jgi:hypothetical protein
MNHIVIDYRMTRDGAPLRVVPILNESGEWLAYCKLCDSEWVEDTRQEAFEVAASHTFLAEASGKCKSGRVAHARHVHRFRYGFYHAPSRNWRNVPVKEGSES